MILTDELYEKFTKLIYKETGLFYDSNKKYFVEKRILKRAQLLDMGSLSEYFIKLKFDQDPSEWVQLINALTVNETYFFRDFPQLRNFAEDVLPIVVKRKLENQKSKKLKVWCAACSTGEEAYTLSIILREMIDNFQEWDVQILASDINTKVLERARVGLYDSRAVKDVPPEYLARYFTKYHEKYLVKANVRQPITFKQINLMDELEMSKIRGCDFIFCRNCLIYFDDESRKKVVDSFYEALLPEGFLFLGHSESVGRISSAYQVQRIGDSILYSKPVRTIEKT